MSGGADKSLALLQPALTALLRPWPSRQSYFWPAAQPKAVLVFCHGHGAHLMFEVLKQTVRCCCWPCHAADPAAAPAAVAATLLALLPHLLLSLPRCWPCFLTCCHQRCSMVPAPSQAVHALFAHGMPVAAPCLCLQNLGEPQTYEGSWAQQWNARGISLCGIDLQARSLGVGFKGTTQEFTTWVHGWRKTGHVQIMCGGREQASSRLEQLCPSHF